MNCPSCGSVNIQKRGHTKTSGKQRISCNDCGEWNSIVPREENPEYVKDINKKCLVITSGQNATPVNEKFLKSLETYCEHNDAQLLVIPLRYKNPTSLYTDKDHDWWDSRLAPYLTEERVKLCETLWLLGDIKVQPTAVTPLTGLEGFTGESSAIIGHPKIQLNSVATRAESMAKLLTTTGSVTVPNYTDTKTGKKGDHHASFAACVVELDGDVFHMRHVHWNGKSFIDWDTEYSPNEVKSAPRPEAIICGDTHQWFIKEEVNVCLFGHGGVVDELEPRQVLLHDCLDSFSISHHHRNKPFTRYAKYQAGMNSLKRELEDLVTWLEEIKRPDVETLIVPSNHDAHIQRWVEESDWKEQPWNAELYLEMALEMVRNTKMTKGGAETLYPFTWWLHNHTDCARVLNGSYMIQDIECSLHGDVGANGARGTLNGFSKLGCKTVIGHGHSPGIRDGAYQVGTSTGQLEYSKGQPSSWLNTMCLIYADGKRTLFNIIKGKARP